MPKEITGYDIIIHWSDGTKEDLDNYGALPYFKNLDHYLDSVQEEVNQQEETDDTEESDA
tara:strand:+ start:1335 stop:1514 length:180 start_codon:yes stop_codon:yes gene_type:complete